jgi:hypothetical protein
MEADAMGSLFAILGVIAIGCAIWGTIAGIMIMVFLDKRGIKTPFVLMRIYFFRNARRFREITIKETGKPGELYYHCTMAFAAALLLGLFALAVKFF